MALERADVDLNKRQLCVARSDWKGHVTMPKGGRLRYVPLTKRLTEALRGFRHLRSPRVLCLEDGSPLTQKVVRGLVIRPSRRVKVKAGVHILRHTFCSHLAMRGAPARAIQELAGHQDLSTTQRYMHLSPAALDAAIRLLDGGRGDGAVPRPSRAGRHWGGGVSRSAHRNSLSYCDLSHRPHEVSTPICTPMLGSMNLVLSAGV